MDRQLSIPDHVVEGPGTNHLGGFKQVVQLGVATASIQRPLLFPYLPNHPLGEVPAAVCFRFPVAGCSIGFVDRLSKFRSVTGSFSLAALAGRCTSTQFVCNGGWNTPNLSGNGTRSETMLFEGFDGTTFSHSEVLSLLAFCANCAIILAVHSDCPPLANVVSQLHSTTEGIITMDFFIQVSNLILQSTIDIMTDKSTNPGCQ